MQPRFAAQRTLAIRTTLVPGDLGSLVRLHGLLYAREYGFDVTFEAYVAGPLAEFVRRRSDRDRLWIAERAGEIVGSIAIVGTSETEAQLRWFLVDPSARGLGLGTILLQEAVAFARRSGHATIFLWTVSALTAAARLYRRFGFQKAEERPARRWGVEVVEERYVLPLADRGGGPLTSSAAWSPSGTAIGRGSSGAAATWAGASRTLRTHDLFRTEACQ
jgi:ribosomal protein S18 acetylase RimI-like enzyme